MFLIHERHVHISFSIFVSPTFSKTKGPVCEGQGHREDLERLIRSLNEQVEHYSQNEEQRRQNEEQRRQNEEQRRQSEELRV